LKESPNPSASVESGAPSDQPVPTRELFPILPGLYLLLDPTFQIVDATDAYAQSTLTTRRALIGLHIFEAFPDNPADPSRSGERNVRASLETVARTLRPDRMEVQRYDIRGRDGVPFEERYWRPLNSPILAADGTLRFILHQVEDVTALVRLERNHREEGLEKQALIQQVRVTEEDLARRMIELADARQRYDAARLLFEDANDAIFIGPIDGPFTDVNNAACRMYRRTRAEMLTLVAEDVQAPHELHRMPGLREKLARGETDVGVWEQVRGDGTTFMAEVSVAILPNGRLHATIRDVTARQRATQELAEAVGRLEQEREVRERLVSAITHDLRTPITAARLSADAILRQASITPSVEKTALRIARSMDRADRMIRDLLDASRLRGGQQLALSVDEADFSRVIAQVVEELTAAHGDRFIVRTQGAPRGFWDADALRRVVENLASNAAKYGDATAPISIDLDGQTEPDAVTLRVHNEGEPIPSAQFGELFKPFSRSEAATARGTPGWGIGLAIVRGLVEGHGGRVVVESAQGQGTTFHVRIPRDSRSSAS
jgi:PAS domain S-box-containing protein